MSRWPYQKFLRFRETLEAAASTWFQSRNIPTQVKYPYCLPSKADWRKNIILNEVAEYVEDCGIKLHKYVHHGLSSQALAFNLLGPFIVRDDLKTLAEAIAGEACCPAARLEIKFEYDDRSVFNEGNQQPTSIDAFLSGGPSKLFIEVKLQEKEFGGCACVGDGNCEGMNPREQFGLCYLHEGARRTYWPQLQQHGFLETPFFSGPICPLTRYYQFYREVVFALAKGGTFVLVVDERNPAFNRPGTTTRGLFPFLRNSVPPEHQARVKCVTVQSIIARVRDSETHGDWVHEFIAKYGMNSSVGTISTQSPAGNRT
jgi:hypothetical protein